jgi:hypothetical protein
VLLTGQTCTPMIWMNYPFRLMVCSRTVEIEEYLAELEDGKRCLGGLDGNAEGLSRVLSDASRSAVANQPFGTCDRCGEDAAWIKLPVLTK